MTVQFAVESLSSLLWNHCPVCRGIGVQFAVEYATLPLQSITAAASLAYRGWEQLVRLFLLRDTLPKGETVLMEMTTAVSAGCGIAELLGRLSRAAEWDMASLTYLVGTAGFNFTSKDYCNGAAVLRLDAAFSVMRRLGASAEQCTALARADLTPDEGNLAKGLARAKYDETQWLERAKTLQDPLRERRRAALVSHLLAKHGLRDANELFSRLLIDVEMSPCMMTTRIKQAISSVQLFIQRCLMGLEPPIVFTQPSVPNLPAAWYNHYGLWEANRWVLFYPEHYIWPALRDDKSPFFKDLESELLQGDVNAVTGETAFLNYLEKLDQVARLEIVAMYHHQEDATDIQYVFGRTYASPHTYFFRRLQDNVWWPWEQLNLDIEGDHLIPIVWNRRLYLFWPLFTEKQRQPTQKERNENADPAMYWEIKLAWSEYKNGTWSGKRLGKQVLQCPQTPIPRVKSLREETPPGCFTFRTRIENQNDTDEQLSIACYVTETITTFEPHLETPETSEPGPTRNFEPLFTVREPLSGTEGKVASEVGETYQPKGNPVPRVVQIKVSIGNKPAKNDQERDYVRFVLSKKELTDKDLLAENLRDNKRNCYDWSVPYEFFTFGRANVQADKDYFISGQALSSRESSPPEKLSMVDMESRKYTPMKGSLYCYLLSDRYKLKKDAAFIEKTEDWGVAWDRNHFFHFAVELENWTPTSKITPAVYKDLPVTKTTAYGIGAFILNGCNSDVDAKPFIVPLSSLSVPGFVATGMMLVRDNPGGSLDLSGTTLFEETTGAARLLDQRQTENSTPQCVTWPLIYQDDARTIWASTVGSAYRFQALYHPALKDFIKSLNRFGVRGLLDLGSQTGYGNWSLDDYKPNYKLVNPPGEAIVDFDDKGAYSLYNWELFFHIPFLIALQLKNNQRFEEAREWFHYIFDPTSGGSADGRGPEQYWKFKPFYELAKQPIQTLQDLLKDVAHSNLREQVTASENDPFKPHLIARLRPIAYMKAVVMRYLDNLIAWGDQLFRRDTLESINEATHLYVLAAEILGRRPESIPALARPKVQTFLTLDLDHLENLNPLCNASVEIECFLQPLLIARGTDAHGTDLTMPFFCTPADDKLLSYWDTVADRLLKIRHCLNIEGVERQLAIYEPRIDPAVLVRAAAVGMDLNSVLNQLNAPLSNYRFAVMLQKATELCNDVKALGGALLAALEKKDAEVLGLLRSTHELELVKAIREVKKQQIEEASNTLAGLMKYEDVITAREQYYLSREFMNPLEIVHMGLVAQSLIPMGIHLGAEVAAAILHLIPDTKLGPPTTAGTTFGGRNVGAALQSFGSASGLTASIMNTGASLSATLGGYQRRKEDWTHQADLAAKELRQVRKQIAAAEIRVAIAERELENHDSQIENAKEVDEYMRNRKFTNQELYSWMVGKISGIYFQGYQLAYDVAKRAERCYRHELGLRDSNFIQFGYWDSLKKGLLSGEQLHHDLKRMDVSYLDQNKRELELTKGVSLAQLDPYALIQLKQSGKCTVNLPETLFDLDYPGHYLRRIKSVSLSIPCITGPYTSVNCTLTQLKSSMRHSTSLIGNKYARDTENDDSRFIDSFGGIQSIATSHAQNDSGMFELNFRDERYLHFEGTGAISTWQLVMPMQFKAFDYATISDVVLHLKYTARDGGSILKGAVERDLHDQLNQLVSRASARGLFRALSLKHEFPTEWHRLVNEKAVSLQIRDDLLPYHVPGATPQIQSATLLAASDLSKRQISVEGESIKWVEIGNNLWEGKPLPTAGVAKELEIEFGKAFSLSVKEANGLEDMTVLVRYTYLWTEK